MEKRWLSAPPEKDAKWGLRCRSVGFLAGKCRVPCRVFRPTRHGSIEHGQQLRPKMSEMSGFSRSREPRRNQVRFTSSADMSGREPLASGFGLQLDSRTPRQETLESVSL